MNLIRIALAAGGLIALTACPGTSKCDSADSVCESDPIVDDSSIQGCGEYTGDTYIDVDSSLCSYPSDAGAAIVWDCDSADWWYDVYTVGWTGGADLLIYQTGSQNPWDENHAIDSYDFDDDGWWDNLYLELAHVDAPADVVEGQTTLYDCGQARKDSLTWQLVIYNVDNSTEEQCVKWGHDPSFVSGCEDISNWF